MLGEYQHSIDAKGRLFIPARLREVLGEVFYVTVSGDRCLTVYSETSFSVIREKYENLPQKLARPLDVIFTTATRCEPDAQGRILLSQKQRAFANLQKDVAIVGLSNRAQIWDASTWAQRESAYFTPESIEAAMEQAGF